VDVVIVSCDPPAQELTGDAEFRGDGAAWLKSAELLLVFTQPAPFRISAVVLVKTAVGDPKLQFAAPKPTKSTTPTVGHAMLRAV
jgi:hypothetical protein